MSAVGAASERARAVPATVRRTGAVASPLGARALVPDAEGPIACVPDGNRSVIVPELTVAYAGRRFMLSVKGAGARAPAYDAFPLDGLGPRVLAAESWMGDAPYGGQGERGALDALAVGALADDAATIAGACVCPLAAVVEVPEAHVRRDCFWYRRFRGPIVQEHRLVPSDVRLFHGTECALGREPERALDAFGVRDVEALDAFIERFLATGIAAITLWARTARPSAGGGFEGLDYDDVWLDKDSLVAPDGSLFLVDLESIEWTPASARVGAAARIAKQFDRNYYDVMYGLDVLLGVRDAWLERAPDRALRRASAAARLGLALAADERVRVIESREGVDLEVRAPEGSPVRVRVIDWR